MSHKIAISHKTTNYADRYIDSVANVILQPDIAQICANFTLVITLFGFTF